MSDWKIYTGSGGPSDRIKKLPKPPPWRDFAARRQGIEEGEDPRGRTFQVRLQETELVNAALYLRRPLIITGPPGCGKSSLAYAVAHELKLGGVLRWSINSRSNLQEGLYQYDALARLQDLKSGSGEDLGLYFKLGPLGTALLPGPRPRVLLIDEIDKADIDLPNDLLHVFEEGEFEIAELVRISSKVPEVAVLPVDGRSDEDRVTVTRGRVQCAEFPLVVLTSNAEREMPPAFRRRCLSLNIDPPSEEELQRIVLAHFEDLDLKKVDELIKDFVRRRDEGPALLATDQLLNAIFLLTRGRVPEGKERDEVLEIVLRELDHG
ncbi:MAG: MoxR family ATPase [bacterium]|nr:MoxR family ATPase [bacterium]